MELKESWPVPGRGHCAPSRTLGPFWATPRPHKTPPSPPGGGAPGPATVGARHGVPVPEPRTSLIELIHPIHNKDVGLPPLLLIAVRRPHQHLPVRRKHRKGIKQRGVGNPLQPAPTAVT